MSGDSVARELDALLRAHHRDRDGGDALVRAVIAHARGLAPADRDELARHLFSLVERETPDVWPVALEVIVRNGSTATADELTDMLAAEHHSAAWSDAMIIAILRLGSADAVALSREYVREELRRHHAGALPMLSWLYRENRDDALDMGARFYAEVLGAATARDERLVEEVRRHLPGQLEGLLAISTAAVLDLVDRVAELDAAAGRTLAAMIAAELRPTAARDRL
ncbi:MAG: hypothetical protein HOQ11_11025, partial [Gemmatimonadaceae bacterium]|nr:hypothetical protein [Gemmatimonadaceae bacterium]